MAKRFTKVHYHYEQKCIKIQRHEAEIYRICYHLVKSYQKYYDQECYAIYIRRKIGLGINSNLVKFGGCWKKGLYSDNTNYDRRDI